MAVMSRSLVVITEAFCSSRLSFDNTRTTQKTMLPTVLVFRVFIAVKTCIPSRYLATDSPLRIH
jgi:hypothetical protein